MSMTTPTMGSADLPLQPRPTAVLMLRTPVPPSTGSDPWHDQFGPYCLPSFPLSALESGSSTPLPPAFTPLHGQQPGADVLRNALQSSATGRRRGRWISDDDSLTTTHLAKPDAPGGEEREWCVTSVPILGHRLIDTPGLVARMKNGPQEAASQHKNYRGVVVTSQRAVDAWAEAAQSVAAELSEGAPAPTTNWPRTPFFAVGPATSQALRQLAPTLPQPLRPSLVMGGGATGTGEAVASYTVRHFHGSVTPTVERAAFMRSGGTPDTHEDGSAASIEPAPVLILVGDKNAPYIPDTLRAAGIPVEVLQVYETCEDASFSQRCDALAHTLPATSSRPGSRRASRAGSASSGRRPSFGSWAEQRRPSFGTAPFGGGSGSGADGAAPTNALALGSIGTMSGAMPFTAMTPFATAAGAQTSSPQPLTPTGAVIEEDDAPPLPLASDIGLGTGTGTKPDWLVFFSPSGLQYALPSLRARRWLPSSSSTSASTAPGELKQGAPEGYPRIAVLGPTTKRAVREVLGFAPDAVASSPEPVELREAIRGAEARIRRERERNAAKREEELKRKDNPDPDGLVEMDTSEH